MTYRKIKEYWEASPPMSFIGEGFDYEQKREFRYSLQDYMHSVFQFANFVGKLVLDLGCGAGIDSAEFARNGARVISVDFTHTATKLTRNLLREADLPSQVVQADATALPFKTDTFDCVYSFGVLHHIPNVEDALAETKRVLKPGGQVMAMVYHKDSLLYAYSIVYLRGTKEGWLDRLSLDEILSRYSERRERCPYTKAYTKDEALGLFSKYFTSVSVDVHYNVIDLPDQRKVKVNLPDKYELGWHLIIKATKMA